MPAIRFEGVAKRFTIHHERARSLQDALLHAFRRRGWREEFWALRDVSFAVTPGEALGVIGANGSGKSTLLKLATRLLAPTHGRVDVRGRVAALLELGAGFHPELSGRDNVYLNASILGIPRRRVDERFADIVEFAGLERFVDTPVKRYSSGMQARLGFAVAVHVEPDVLLLDEVLAVGDLQFQERCLDRIRALHAAGRTILLVSHDLTAVAQFCTRVLWLDDGQVRALGAPGPVIEEYRRHLLGGGGREMGARAHSPVPSPQPLAPTGRRWGSGEIELVGVELLDGAGRPATRFATGEPLVVRLRYHARRRVRRPVFGVAIYAGGLQVGGPNTRVDGQPIEQVEGEGELRYRIEALPLLAGAYTLSAAVYDEQELHPFDHHHQCYPFRVVSPDGVERYGLIDLAGAWEMVAGSQPVAVGQEPPAVVAAPRGALAPPARLSRPAPLGEPVGPGHELTANR
ncbi:MAG TPA: ABC transporter ATP-binding protein [Chloroflexota bacterium]|nr:ABC transporter ATP-binding protein [Chloroflexota bacterium]